MAFGDWQSQLIYLHSLYGGEASSLSDYIPSNNMVNSESVWVLQLVILAEWLGMMFINLLTWLAEWFCCKITYLAWFHGQDVNTNPIPTWIRMWQLSLFNQAVEECEHGRRLSSLTLSVTNARTGFTLWWGWYWGFISLFRVFTRDKYPFWYF